MELDNGNNMSTNIDSLIILQTILQQYVYPLFFDDGANWKFEIAKVLKEMELGRNICGDSLKVWIIIIEVVIYHWRLSQEAALFHLHHSPPFRSLLTNNFFPCLLSIWYLGLPVFVFVCGGCVHTRMFVCLCVCVLFYLFVI